MTLNCLVMSAALAACATLSPAHAETAWQKLTYSDPRHPSVFTPLVAPLWQRELAGTPFHQIHATRIEADGATYLVSVAFAGGLCEMGANGRNAVAEPAICPARVDLLRDGKVVSTTRGRVCSVAPLPEDTTANQSDKTEARFDPATQTISFRSFMSSKPVRTCQRQMKLRP
ncbi:hypothetical protein [Methylobacterium gregans]|uniref:Lipoprotein n=1 Tax=Methylobacterium gregans TaxID=374424 RepID=A0AA37HUB3_9HYPH|nr:hypothetical protein [Methylobacterium gregans]MDQ0518841.1 hypothetical protein [Methylobacterium gregans]GJD81770.1 hypothetical protein NBEOAGPD_5024 [Methylobacterium gregans]GLS57246.1 hypothetical protein GCM10007886_54320 [Methylobacterium gregans]